MSFQKGSRAAPARSRPCLQGQQIKSQPSWLQAGRNHMLTGCKSQSTLMLHDLPPVVSVHSLRACDQRTLTSDISVPTKRYTNDVYADARNCLYFFVWCMATECLDSNCIQQQRRPASCCWAIKLRVVIAGSFLLPSYRVTRAGLACLMNCLTQSVAPMYLMGHESIMQM
jgi:hypothetical protein